MRYRKVDEVFHKLENVITVLSVVGMSGVKLDEGVRVLDLTAMLNTEAQWLGGA